MEGAKAMSEEVAIGMQKLAYAILICAAEDLNAPTDYKSPYASRIAVKNKTSAIKFFQSKWFAEIAQAIGKTPKRLRDAVLT
jgi:hypothetical protein